MKEFAKRLYRIMLITRMYCSPIFSLRLLAKAIVESFNFNANSEEIIWIERIEKLRKRLASSPVEISLIDYGARNPHVNLTEEDMHQGIVLNRTIGEICQVASKSYFWSFLLFKLIRYFKPLTCIELGTCLGISTSYQAAALKLNQQGKMITLEGAESLASLSKENFQFLGLDNINVVTGRFSDTLDNVLTELAPTDYAFIDGHHDETATLIYFHKLFASFAAKGIMAFDDISWSTGMRRAWDTIIADENVKISIDLGQLGICIIDRDIKRKHIFKIPV